jgi:hypothetical protein
MRTPTRETAAGFCSKCGIIREDHEGIPITDCICTAKMKHDEGCQYIKAVSMPVSVGGCDAHGLDACEECDCDCKQRTP